MKKFFTVVFWLLFTILFTLVLLLGETRFDVMTPAFVKDALRETDTYGKLVDNPELLTSQLPGQEAVQGAAQAAPDGAKLLTDALLKSVEKKWLERQTERGIDAVYRYVTSDTANIKFTLDLREFKARLLPNLTAAVAAEYNKLPEIPVEQFDQQLTQSPGKFPASRPAGHTLQQTIAKVGTDPVREIMKRIPDDYVVDFADNNEAGTGNGLAGFKQIGQAANTLSIVFWVLMAVTVVLLLLFAKLTSKTLLEFLMRLGIFMSAALAPLALALVGWYIVANILLVDALTVVNLPSAAVRQLIEPLAAFVVNRTFVRLTLWSAGISLIGLLLAILTGIKLHPQTNGVKVRITQ